jgi:hypothetical protein
MAFAETLRLYPSVYVLIPLRNMISQLSPACFLRPFDARYVLAAGLSFRTVFHTLGSQSFQTFDHLACFRRRETLLYPSWSRVSMLCGWYRFSEIYIVLRVPYTIWLMHRRTDLWGPDGVL